MGIAAVHACLLNFAIYPHYPDYLVGALTDKATVGALMLDGDDEDDKQRSTEHLLAVLAYVKKQRTACLPKMFAFCRLHHGIGFLVEREKLTLFPMAWTCTPGPF